MKLRSLWLAAPACVLLACSSHDPEDHSSHDAGTAADSGAPAEAGTAADTGPKTGKPATPQMVSAAKMAGDLHVTWKLNDTQLTSVSYFRNKDGGAFVKTMLAGTATSQHDTEASTAGATYCFKVLTTRDGIDSDESNETCGSP